jgi:putative FmdB family regulatory protein
MPLYDFKCINDECDVDIAEALFGMEDQEGRDAFRCPVCGGETNRVFTSPNAVIKSTLADMALEPHQAIIDCDGQPIRLNFIDHGDRSSDFEEGSVAKKMPGARMDEKTGRAVVDVVSNVPDPLGKIERSKQQGVTQTEVKNINEKVKTRGK